MIYDWPIQASFGYIIHVSFQLFLWPKCLFMNGVAKEVMALSCVGFLSRPGINGDMGIKNGQEAVITSLILFYIQIALT